MSDWHEMGVDHGWSHQNYVTAYGKEHDGPISYPATLQPDSRYGFSGTRAHERVEARRDFAAGWKLGRARYRRGLNVDGSKESE